MEECDQESFRKDQARSKNHRCRGGSDTFPEGVETDRRHYEAANNGQERQQVNSEEHGNLTAVSAEKQHDSLWNWLRYPGAAFS